MRKTLFWLLVMIFPFVGLVASMCLTPRHAPLWTYSSNNANLLGIVEDGKTVLLLEDGTNSGLNLVGIANSSGQESYRIPLIAEQLHSRNVWLNLTAMSSDGKHVVFLRKHVSDSRRKQLILYSVQNRSVINQFDMEPDDVVFEMEMSGNTIAAYCSDSKILLLDATDPAKKQWIPWHKGELHSLSPDGTMHYELSRANAEAGSQLHCYDIRQQQTLVELPVHCLLMNWLSNAHFETMNEDANGLLLINNYVRTGNSFQPDPDKERTIKALFGWKATFRKMLPEFLIAVYTNEQHPMRTWLHSWNNGPLSKLTETIWPTQLKLELVNRTSLNVEHRLVVDDGEFGFMIRPTNICCNPRGIAYAIGDHICYWQFNPLSRYIPLIGLTAGCLVSLAMLVRRLGKPSIIRQANT